MKTLNLLISLSAVTIGGVFGGQSVVERGPHHNVVQNIEVFQENGQAITRTNYFTELGSGINFWSAEQNLYVPSSDEIELLETGAIYRKGQYQLKFASNINDANGAVEWTPEAGKHLILQTIGIAIVEEASGDSIWLGQIKDTQGFLTARNEVTYPSCFDQIDADVRISVSPSGFQNDVVLKENIVDPAKFGFQGPCRIEVWHNVISGPEPQLEASEFQRSPTRSEADTQLKFGPMYIGSGAAFLVGQEKEALSGAAGTGIRVSKDYFIDPETQTRFLIESVPLGDAAAHLQSLPAPNHARVLDAQDKKRMMAMRRTDGKRHRPMALKDSSVPAIGKERIVAMSPKKIPLKGLLLDFSSLVTVTNKILTGDTTYVVATNTIVNLSGTTVIEPGCVIKMGAYNPTNSTPFINILGALDCQTRPYAPCVITSREDRTVGETNTALLASIATNAYGACHLCFPASNTNAIQLHDIRSRYALNAFAFLGPTSVEAWNIQVYGAQADVFEGAGNNVTLRNVLVHNANNVTVATANNTAFVGEHFTIHSASKTFAAGSFTGCTLKLTNSLTVVVTNSSSSGVTTVSCANVSDDAGVFQTVGAGAHYLASASPYRDAGSVDISTNLTLGVFTYSTTFPPLILTNTITANTTLAPQAQRDVDAPDQGYHYPAIDWAVSNVGITNGIILVLTNGVSVATYGISGFTLRTSSTLACEGRPTQMNRLIHYANVQEQPTIWGATGNTITLVTGSPSATQTSLRFTEAAFMANPTSRRNLFLIADALTTTIRDSEFYSIYSPFSNYTESVLNCLWHRSYFEFSSAVFYLDVKNNLLRYSTLVLETSDSSAAWNYNVTDNVFDNASFNIWFQNPNNSNNGYINTTQAMGGTANKTITTVDYQTGVLGKWYYPTSGTGLFTLVDAGSRTASSAGLYHFATRTDHTKDSSTVDIGYHYIALDSSGNPVDTDGDGLPDYLEDKNGNGTADVGEFSWTSPVNGASGLTIFTPLQP
jgi:hypothetical protein